MKISEEFKIEEYKQLFEQNLIFLKQRDFNITAARIVTFAALTTSFSSFSQKYILLSEIILIFSSFLF